SWKNLFFSTLLIGISSGALYAFGAYDNVFPYGTPLPPGHWIAVEIQDDSGSTACEQMGTWLWVMQRNAIISVFWFTINNGQNVVALPYKEPVWVYGYPNDQGVLGGPGCTVWPEQTLALSGPAGRIDPGTGFPIWWSCRLICP
ncbi:MAG: hypothetical protein AAB066_03000, partial [Candidatus Margulisiibacteriota bacterium]